MLKYSITDNPVGSVLGNPPQQNALDWLSGLGAYEGSGYLPDRIKTVINRVVGYERLERGYTYDFDWYLTAKDGIGGDLVVDVVLRPDAWVDPFGRTVVGLFWQPWNTIMRPKVEISWKHDFEQEQYRGIVSESEFAHMLEYYDKSSPTWWTDWQHILHGKASVDSNGKLQDPYAQAINKRIGEGYRFPVTHSYHPGFLPCSGVQQIRGASVDSNSLAIVNLYSDGSIEVRSWSGNRIPALEKMTTESCRELLNQISTGTAIRHIHRESGASCELTADQLADRLLIMLDLLRYRRTPSL